MATRSDLRPLGPLRFRPVLKDYVWGGRGLERLVGRELPEGTIAESWEISDHPHGETRVEGGPWDGTPLGQLLPAFGLGLVGRRNLSALDRRRFPLLIKLLDANEWLSVQVHPGDEYARAHEGDQGKTEMWVVLHARPGSEIILGLERSCDAATLERAIASGESGSMFHRLPARPGDAFFVPAGVVHAIGPGLVLAEIQQSSDVTYRLYDWDRTDASGSGRALHLAQALEVADFSAIRPSAVRPQRLEEETIERELLVSCPYFRTERLRLAGNAFDFECDGSTFELWAVLSGTATLETSLGSLEVDSVSWTLLPANLGAVSIRSPGSAELLRVFTPAKASA